ncbi:MAG TPA: FtsX-like permease family protein [Actinomycetota bacterium]|nr:FtsX-like permease family protein [Actinomycetota bacterium]
MKGLIAFLRRVNARHLLEKRLRTALTVGGVAAGVALVTSITVINSTLLSSVRESIRNLAGAAEIEVASADETGLPVAAVDDVEAVEGVDAAVPVSRTTAHLTGPDGEADTMILGVGPDFLALFPNGLGEAGRIAVEGTLGRSGRGLVLAEQVASGLGVGIGDEVEAETPSGTVALPVTGLVSGPGISLLNGGDVGTMALPAAQEAFEKEGRVDSVYVVVEEDASAGDVEQDIDAALGGAAIVGPPGERGEAFERTFESIAALTSLAGAVSLFVALFVVYNTMSIALAERRREVSMAIALGAKRSQLFAAFLAEAGLLGTIASSGGVAAGIVLARVLVGRAVDQFAAVGVRATGPLAVEPWHVLLGLGAGIAVSLTGAFLPARRIMKVAPVEALRPEAGLEWARTRTGALSRTASIGLGAAGIVACLGGMALYIETGEYLIAVVALAVGLGGVTTMLPVVVPLAVRILRPAFARLFGTTGRLAADGLAKNPGRTSVTVGSLVLTLGLVIGVGGAVGSFDAQFRDFARHWYSQPLYVQTNSYTGGVESDQPLSGRFVEALERVEGVDNVLPFRYANLTADGEQVIAYVHPTSGEAREDALEGLSVGGVDSEPLVRALERGEVVVAEQMAQRRELDAGDSIGIATPRGVKDFAVGGFFNDLASFDSMYIAAETYRRHWFDDRADAFGVDPLPGVPVATVERRLRATVESEGMPARVIRKEEQIENISATVDQIFSIAEGIQLAALLVAFLTIVNTMFTAVIERRWEFGLQQAIGMGRRQLGWTVVLEAAGIGIVGGAGAIVLGSGLGVLMLLSMNFLYAFDIPYQPPWELFAFALAAGTALAALSAVYPRRLATRLQIVECLRYE